MQASRIFVAAISKVIKSSLVVYDFTIQNIVASGDCGFSVRLEGIADLYRRYPLCNYEPELFPGLIFKMPDPKVVLLIFTSGKVVLAGAKSRQDLYIVYKKIYPVLNKFKKRS